MPVERTHKQLLPELFPRGMWRCRCPQGALRGLRVFVVHGRTIAARRVRT